jgi:hypothetical protein
VKNHRGLGGVLSLYDKVGIYGQLEKLSRRRFVTGHDFSRVAQTAKSTWALQAAEKLVALKGHGFSRALNAVKSARASAPEGCFHCSYLKSGLFPQPV